MSHGPPAPGIWGRHQPQAGSEPNVHQWDVKIRPLQLQNCPETGPA